MPHNKNNIRIGKVINKEFIPSNNFKRAVKNLKKKIILNKLLSLEQRRKILNRFKNYWNIEI